MIPIIITTVIIDLSPYRRLFAVYANRVLYFFSDIAFPNGLIPDDSLVLGSTSPLTHNLPASLEYYKSIIAFRELVNIL